MNTNKLRCPYCKGFNVSDLIDRMVCHDCKSVDMLNEGSINYNNNVIIESPREYTPMTRIGHYEFEQLKSQVNFLNNKLTEMRAKKKDEYKYR